MIHHQESHHTHISLIKESLIWSTRTLLHQTFMWVFYRPNLNSRVHVIVDVIIFQHTMAIVIEVDPNLWKHTLWLYWMFCISITRICFSSPMVYPAYNPTCFPLCILFLLRTGVLPVVTHTPASVLLYTSFSSMTPCPFSCCRTQSHRISLLCDNSVMI